MRKGLWRHCITRSLVLLAAFSLASSAIAGEVAITFDDLPLFGRTANPAEANRITSNLHRGFRRHHWQVTGFVNEIQLEGPERAKRIQLLRRWLNAGMDPGNHGYSHLSLTRTAVDVYIADVARGATVTQWLLAERGRTERWYRHPYLETVTTPAIRDRFESWLSDHGYRVAPVSMENSDWQFAEPYDDAIARGNSQQADRIRAAYQPISHTPLMSCPSTVVRQQASLDGSRRSCYGCTRAA